MRGLSAKIRSPEVAFGFHPSRTINARWQVEHGIVGNKKNRRVLKARSSLRHLNDKLRYMKKPWAGYQDRHRLQDGRIILVDYDVQFMYPNFIGISSLPERCSMSNKGKQ